MLAKNEYLLNIFRAATHLNAHVNFDDLSSENVRFLTFIQNIDDT